MPQEAGSAKRQYAHIKDDLIEQGKAEPLGQDIATRVVSKEREQRGGSMRQAAHGWLLAAIAALALAALSGCGGSTGDTNDASGRFAETVPSAGFVLDRPQIKESASEQVAPIALVQHANKDAGATTSSSLAFSANNAAGNWIAVIVRAGRSNQTIAVNDSLGNVYRQAIQTNVTVDAPTGATLAIFYAESIRAGANTIAVSATPTSATLRIAILEYSGIAPAGSLHGGAAAQGISATPSSGSTAPIAGGDLALGAIMTADPRTFTAGNGFAISDRVPALPGTKLIAQARIQSAPGAASADATLDTSNPWGAVVAAFRAAPASPQADLTLTMAHVGAFRQGQVGATYTLTVSNSGSVSSAGTVTVTDILPAGLNASGIGGSNWNCTLAPLRCSRSDALAAGTSYPPISLTVNVASNAPASVTNTASVSGGGELNSGNNAATDVTPIGTSTSDTLPPSAPSGLTTAVSAGRTDLRWTASTDNVGVAGYRVEQCQGAGCTDFREVAQVATAPVGTGPLTVSANPNYFKDTSGTPLILNGSHTWNNLQDWGSNGSLQALDFDAYVDFLVAHGHNFTLLWYIELPKFCGFPTTSGSPPDFTVGPHPWQRTGPGNATDGAPKFDLTKFNQAYFDRLRARVQALNDAGIYVGVYTFTAEWVLRYRCGTDGYPFTGTNNINGINDGGGTGSFTMNSPNAITAVQDAYVEKVIDTLNTFPNVLWMVSEEAPNNSTWWNAHQISHIRSYESGKPHQHPIGYGVLAEGGTDAQLFNSNADWVTGVSWITPTTSCGSGTPTCKVNVNDSDHSYFGIWNDSAQTNRNFAWQNFTQGNQVMFMDPYVLYYPREDRNSCPSPINGICARPNARWDNFRNNLGYILSYSRRLNLANVTPRSSLCSTGNCLAQTPAIGAEYLVYAPGGGSFTVSLSAMSSTRTLNVEWLNPSTGATITGTPVAAGATRTFTPPFSGDAVLYLVDSSGHAGSVPLATSYSVTGLTPGTYSYRVRAVDAAGNLGSYSIVASATIQGADTQPPTAPSGLSATTPGDGQVRLSWTPSTDNVGVASHLLERCTGTGCTSFVQVASIAGTATTFGDTGLAASTGYTYRVRATDAMNNLGPYSNTATATTTNPPAAIGITLQQHASSDAGSVASSSLGFASNNTAGNWIAVAVRSWPSSQALTVADARGNTYRKAIQLNETADGMALAVFYAENIAGGSNAVTVSRPQPGGTLRFAILEYTGVALTNSLGGTAAAQGTGTAPSSGAVAPASIGDLVIGVLATANERTFIAGAGYLIQERVPAAPSTKLAIEDRRQATATALSAGATLNASDNWAAVAAAFRAAGP